MKRLLFTALGIAIFWASCTSVPETTGQTTATTETKPAATYDFAGESRKLIESANWSKFLTHYYQYAEKYPIDSPIIWAEAVKAEQTRFASALTSGIFKDILFHYYNRRALAETANARAQLDGQLNAWIATKGFKYFSTYTGPGSIASLRGASGWNLKKFEDILASLSVYVKYKTKEGIERKSSEILASGFLIDDKHVLTNYHAVSDTNWNEITGYEITVTIKGKKYKGAKLLGSDYIYDLAIIELSESVAPGFSLKNFKADSDQIGPGDAIYCAGQHLGLSNTLTKGIVSANQRKAFNGGYWIQVDAEVSPGASGGPAFDETGRIVGVNVASVFGENISFIIPINTACSVIDQMLDGQTLMHPWLGISLIKDETTGALLTDYLYPGSPLYSVESGIDSATSLLEINGIKVTEINAAQDALIGLRAGNLVRLKIKTAKDEKSFVFQTDSHPMESAYTATEYRQARSDYYLHYGMELVTKSYNTSNIYYEGRYVTVYFYRVKRVRSDSPADRLGIKEKDSVGVIVDTYEERTHFSLFVHLPEALTLSSVGNMNEYLFILTADGYDENAL